MRSARYREWETRACAALQFGGRCRERNRDPIVRATRGNATVGPIGRGDGRVTAAYAWTALLAILSHLRVGDGISIVRTACGWRMSWVSEGFPDGRTISKPSFEGCVHDAAAIEQSRHVHGQRRNDDDGGLDEL